jgi:hypothetical protein
MFPSFLLNNPHLLMLGNRELKRIAKSRVAEARVLFRERKYDGARYVLGYAIEAALKAIICKKLKWKKYPPDGLSVFKIHKIDVLIALAGLEDELQEKKQDPKFAANWSIVTGWNENLRYEPIGTASREQVEGMIKGITNRNAGVLTWLKTIW